MSVTEKLFLFVHQVCLVIDTVKSVTEGDSVSLKINVTETQTGDKIEWKFVTNRNPIAKINGRTSKTFDGPDGIFRDRLNLDNQTVSLTITDTRIIHSGLEIDRYTDLPIFFPIFKHFTLIGYRFCNIGFTDKRRHLVVVLRIARRIAIAARLRGDETTTTVSRYLICCS